MAFHITHPERRDLLLEGIMQGSNAYEQEASNKRLLDHKMQLQDRQQMQQFERAKQMGFFEGMPGMSRSQQAGSGSGVSQNGSSPEEKKQSMYQWLAQLDPVQAAMVVQSLPFNQETKKSILQKLSEKRKEADIPLKVINEASLSALGFKEEDLTDGIMLPEELKNVIELQKFLSDNAQSQKDIPKLTQQFIENSDRELMEKNIEEDVSPRKQLFGDVAQEKPKKLGMTSIHDRRMQAKEDQAQRELRKFATQKSIEKGSDYLAKIDKERDSLVEKSKALNTMESSIQNMPEGFSKDYMADLFNYEPFRSSSGAAFKTASKEFLLGNLIRAGARPNQWIEQQIADMSAKIGRSKAANETFVALAQGDIDIGNKRIELTDEISDAYRQEKGYVPDTISRDVDKALKPYIEQKEKEIYYELRTIYEKENPDSITKNSKVPSGTPLTIAKAKHLISISKGKDQEEKANNAETLAKKLGYTIMSDDFYEGL